LGTYRASRRPASPVILIDANLLLYAYHPRAVSAGAKIPHWKQPNGSVAPE